jgi:hypothetical protein
MKSATMRLAFLCLLSVAAGGPIATTSSAQEDPAPVELPGVQVPDSLRTEVLGFVESYYAALSARDWEAFQEHFWPGATISTVWRPPGEDSSRVVVGTVPGFVERAPEGPGSREIFQERMIGAEVLLSGGLAQVWALYRARFGDPGDVTEWVGIDAFTLMKHQGTWKILSIAFAPER